jgi:hypothetical protein
LDVLNNILFEAQMTKAVYIACVSLHMNSIESVVVMKLIADESARQLTQVIVA